jgi:hypothetical protein
MCHYQVLLSITEIGGISDISPIDSSHAVRDQVLERVLCSGSSVDWIKVGPLIFAVQRTARRLDPVPAFEKLFN